MEKKKSLLKIIATVVFGIVFIIIAIVSCNQSKTVKDGNNGDTAVVEEFMPHAENGKLNVDLQGITLIRFPRYKTAKVIPFVSGSISLVADEESTESDNYSATLLLNTIPDKEFYQRIDLAAQHDTCWGINESAYIYERKDKAGGMYRVAFSRDRQQIFVAHLNRDMIKNMSRTKSNK